MREKIRELLKDFLIQIVMYHLRDIDQATTAILEAFKKIVPKPKILVFPRNYKNNDKNCEIAGYNKCRSEILAKLEGKDEEFVRRS